MMDVLANPWKGKQRNPAHLASNAPRVDGTEVLSKIVASTLNNAGNPPTVAGSATPFSLPPGAVIQPNGHRAAPPDRPGLIPITIPVPVAYNGKQPRNSLVPKLPEDGTAKTKFMFAVAFSMEQTEDATGCTHETFALTTTLKESFGKYIPGLPFGGSEAQNSKRGPPMITAPPAHFSHAAQQFGPPSRSANVRQPQRHRSAPHGAPPPPPPLPPPPGSPKSEKYLKKLQAGSNKTQQPSSQPPIPLPKYKKTPVVVQAGQKVVDNRKPSDDYQYDEALKNVPLLEPFAVSQGDPFHFQILGMQDALMDITEEIGRIFNREKLAMKIIQAPDSQTRAQLINNMTKENRVELIRMAKSLQLFRWLLIQVLTSKYRDRSKLAEAATEKYEITGLAQWYRLAAISGSLIEHCGHTRDCYSTQLESLLKFVDQKLGTKQATCRLSTTASLTSKGVPKIGLLTSGTLRRNTVLEQFSRCNMKAGSSLVVSRRAGGAQKSRKQRTPPSSATKPAEKVPVEEPHQPAAEKVVKPLDVAPEVKTNVVAQQQQISPATYMDELAKAVKERAAKMTSQHHLDCGDNQSVSRGASIASGLTVVQSLPEIPNLQ